MNRKIALIGNPNCGKTTLFNLLTGSYQKVGNWSGVTVEKKIGEYKKNRNVNIIDLPGLYSLDTNSNDEKIVINFLKNDKPDIIIDIIDGTNLERNLYLTAELINLKIPIIIAINFCDTLSKKGIKIDIKNLEKHLGVPVVLISAYKNIGIEKLMNIVTNYSDKPRINIENENIFDYIKKIVSICKVENRKNNNINKIDNIVLNKYFAFPIFFLIIFSVYFFSIKIGGLLSNEISIFFDWLSCFTQNSLQNIGFPNWFISLLCNAIISGLGGVTCFLPQVIILFLLLAILEETGYMARVSFIFDRLFRKIGLGGKSIIPIVLASGCTVTGLLSTRTIENERERRLTIFLLPFMPCSAKLAVFAYFSSIFFNGSALIATLLYFSGIFVICIFGKIFASKSCNMDNSLFLEIPPYRVPSIKNLLLEMREKTKEFLIKAGTIIFTVSIFLWLLKSFGSGGFVGERIENSFMYLISNGLKVIFMPIGIDKPELISSLISGIFAKEGIIESLSSLSKSPILLFDNYYKVFSYVFFILYSPPCIASLSQLKRELKSFKDFVKILFFEFTFAYFVAFVINSCGLIFSGKFYLIFIIFAIIILSIIMIKIIKRKIEYENRIRLYA